MKALKLLCVLFVSFSAKGQNLESVLSINEVGLEATFSTFDFDEDGNLFVALNLGFALEEDSSQFVVLNYPNGRDTLYYEYKKRIYLLKLNTKGNLKKLLIGIEDSVSYDFFHNVSDIKIINQRLHFIIPKVLRTEHNYALNDKKPIVINDTCLHYLTVATYDLDLNYHNAYAFGYDGANAYTSFIKVGNKPFLHLLGVGNLGKFSVPNPSAFLIEKDGKLELVDDTLHFDLDELLHNSTILSSLPSANKFLLRSISFNAGKFLYKTLEDANTNSRDPISASSNSGNSIFLGSSYYLKTYTNDTLDTRFGTDTPYFEKQWLTDYFNESSLQSFRLIPTFIGFKPDIGVMHWFSGVNFINHPFEFGDSLTLLATVWPNSFQYQFDTFTKEPHSYQYTQLARFNINYNGDIDYEFISSINTSNGVEAMTIMEHNGYAYLKIDNTDFPKTVVLDSVTGFTYNPNKVIARYQLYAPPKYVPEITFNQTNCSGGTIKFKSKDAEHYTVLIANDSIRDFPRPGKTYNYSPNYLLSPKLTNDVRILYQGPDTSIAITNLVSGRQYFIAVVPGNGQDGSTLYNPDSSAFVEFTLNSVFSKPKIYPKSDTALCAFDSIYAEANSSYTIRWMDGKSVKKRFVAKGDDFSYTIKETSGCVLSSDTVNISFKPTPKIDSVFTLQKEPFCFGDTIDVEVATRGDVIWSNGSRDRRIQTDSSGLYRVSVSNSFGCSDSAQVAIKFSARPYFNFTMDSTISIDGQAEIEFNTNAFKTDFIYQNDTSALPNYSFYESGFLKANAFNNTGCFVSDSLLIRSIQSQTEIFPNAFSPNNDGVNDEWFFIHPDTAGTLMVFDKWGGKVYHGTNNWDGKKLGEALPIGAYRYTFIPNEGDVKRGLIFLVK